MSFRAARLLVVPDSKCHLLSGFSDLPGTGYILYTSAYTPCPDNSAARPTAMVKIRPT
jgi:hypothetical protein